MPQRNEFGHINTGERHAAVHSFPCNGIIWRYWQGDRYCGTCHFQWSPQGWADEMRDRRERQKEARRHG